MENPFNTEKVYYNTHIYSSIDFPIKSIDTSTKIEKKEDYTIAHLTIIKLKTN